MLGRERVKGPEAVALRALWLQLKGSGWQLCVDFHRKRHIRLPGILR